MTENQNTETNQNDSQNIQIHVAPDLDYSYRDIANIFVGSGDVVIEFGNHHRAMPGNITIANRIVMTIANAYDLQQKLQQVLLEAQKVMAQQMQQSNNP